MSLVGVVLAWGGLAVLAYVYVGYPLLLWGVARLRGRGVRKADATPSVTLVISAFNEAAIIGEKLENALALEYPPDRLDILVVSDASTDHTDRIVGEFRDRGVRLLSMPSRGGKTVGLNAAMTTVQSDVVVFSDANIRYRQDAVRMLVRSFADPTVGCVTGDSQYVDPGESAAHVQEDTYWGYERFIRSLESLVGSTVGGDGAIFAIRRRLYTPLATDAINDFVTPLQIVARGYRAVFEPNAVGVEASAGGFSREFRRKRRIVNRSWRGVMSVTDVLNPLRVGVFAWQVWSHKILRWLTLPVVLLTVAGCAMALSRGVVYQLGLGLFAASLVLAAVGALVAQRAQGALRLAQAALYFYLVNVAAALGIARAMAGHVEVVWVSERV
jgi:cellulose synthase/poly-beta-1,6-N-acetylglucosamine synthase-like glycosyltransferase